MIKIQIKKLSNSVLLPKYETPGSSGMDIAAHIGENVIINLQTGEIKEPKKEEEKPLEAVK